MNPMLEKRLEEFLNREDAKLEAQRLKKEQDAKEAEFLSKLKWELYEKRLKMWEAHDRAVYKQIVPQTETAPSIWSCIIGGKK